MSKCATDVMFEYLREVQQIGRDLGVNGADVVEEALARVPRDHKVHRLAATAWRCTGCGGTGFLADLILLVETATVECPHCAGEETAVVLDDARETA